DREDVEQAARVLGQGRDAGADHVIEAGLSLLALALREDIPRQLVQEEGMAGGLACDRVGLDVGTPAVLREVKHGEIARPIERELPHPEVDELAYGGPRRTRLAQHTEQPALRLVLASVARDQEERWRRGGGHDLVKEDAAVAVPPLEIVDVEKGRALVGEPLEQLSQRRGGAPPELLRVRDLVRPLVRAGERL